MALCPGHDDRNPSLSIREHDDGVGIKCHAGCATEEILKPLGMTSEDLQLRAVLRTEQPKPKVEPKKENEYYLYTDTSGNPLFRVRRGPGKNFSQQHWDAAAGVWRSGLGGTRTTLYRLPELLAVDDSRPVFICEGEKDADRLAAEGLTATCNPMGAGKWKEEYAQYLKDRRVIVIPDNDAPGEAHAQDILQSLGGSGAILRLPDLPDKGDVSDWLQAGHTAKDLLGLMEGINNGSPRSNGHHRLNLRTGRELMEKKFPPVKWVVPGLLPAGSMLFGGAVKMGKSWLALGLCISVATGGKALGHYEVEEGDTCYLALEDVERRLQDRASLILQSDLAGHQNLVRWQYTETASRLDQGLVDDIEQEFLTKVPDPRLVVIDTLAAVRGPSQKGRNIYEQDYEAVRSLHQLANAYDVAILIVTHLNQSEHKDFMNKITGSAGLTGGVDGSLVLDRGRGEADAVMYAAHRDLKEDPELALQKVDAEEGWWRYIGNAEEYRLSKDKRNIMITLANMDEPMRPSDVATALSLPAPNVSKTMQRMRDERLLKSPSYGVYEVAPGVDLPAQLTANPPVQPVQPVKVKPEDEVGHLDNLDRLDNLDNLDRDEEGIWWPDDE